MDGELKYLHEHFEQVCLKNNIICVNLSEKTEYDTLFGTAIKKLVPLALRRELMHSAHSSKQSGNFKLKLTVHRIASKFHWRSLKADVASFISQCVHCNITGDTKSQRLNLQ